MLGKLEIELGSKIAILGVLDAKASTSYCCLILQKRRKQLKIVSFHNDISTLGELKTITKKLPIVLSLLGSKVLHTHENSLYLNSNDNEYNTTTYTSKSGKNFTALARIDYVNEVKETFEQNDFHIVDIFSGVLEVSLLYKKLFDQKEFQVFNLIVEYDNDDCIGIKKANADSSVSSQIGEEIKNNLEIFLFSVGLSFYNESENIERIQEDENLLYNKQELKYKDQMDQITKVGSLIFLSVLLLNFILSAYYNYQSKKINNQMFVMKAKQRELSKLTVDKERKTKFIELSGFLNANYITYYVNEITAILPRSLVLISIDALPIESKINYTNQKIVINDRLVKVEGVSRESQAFNTWIDSLQAKDWVDKISITKYEQKNSSNTNFEIEMELK